MHRLLLALCLPTLLVSCSSSGDDNLEPSADGSPATEPCSVRTFDAVAPLETPLKLLGAGTHGSAGLALASGASGLVVIGDDLEVTLLDAVEPLHAALSGGNEQPLCATWIPAAGDVIKRACAPTFEITSAAATFEVRDTFHVAESQDGPIAFYQGRFASADAAKFAGNTWSPIELYESSVSLFRDAISADGAAYGCMIDAGDRAAIVGMNILDADLGLAALERLYTESISSARRCELASASGVLSAIVVDRDGAAHRGSAPIGALGLQTEEWATEPLDLDFPLLTRFDYARSDDSEAIVLRNDDTGENVLHKNSDGQWNTTVLTEGGNMGYPVAAYDRQGALYIASTGTVNGEFGVGFYRHCPSTP